MDELFAGLVKYCEFENSVSNAKIPSNHAFQYVLLSCMRVDTGRAPE